MKIALVHDDLVQWGGAERVLAGISEIFPDAPIYTSIYDKDNEFLSQLFGSKKIVTSFLQKIPAWKTLYKSLLPFYPIAFEQFDFTEFDLVISHGTRFAKSIITKPTTVHINYCHTPPRFLWRFSKDGYGLGEILMSKLRIYDQVSSKRVDLFIAGSKNAQKRIKKIYKANSKVVYPFVDLARFQDVEVFNGGYFVVIGRPNKYKRFDLAKNICEKIGVELKVITGDFTDEMVVHILAGCQALIIPGEEDFGLTALEAQALGKPVIAYRGGGALETVIEGETGIFFSDPEDLYRIVKGFNSEKFKKEDCRKQAARFSKDQFQKKFKLVVTSLL